MKYSLIIISLLLSFQSLAQISVDAGDFIDGADTVLVSVVSDYQNINYQTTGANSTWDFTNVVIDSQRVDTYGDVISAGILYQLTFNNQFFSPDYRASYFVPADEGLIPTNGLPVTIENPIVFEKISSAKYERVGLGLEVSGVGLPIEADPIDVVFEFPMTYQDNWANTSGLLVDFNPGFNAIFKRVQNRSSSVDGYGTITTPFGTFDCIRVRSDILYADSIYFDLGFGASWIPLPTPAETQYRWIAKNQKVPVMTIDVSNGFGGPEITKMQFRDSKGVASNESFNKLSDVTVFPNPAVDQLNIAGLKGNESITITNLNGQVIYQTNDPSNSNVSLSSADWARGMYVVKVINQENSFVKKIILQ